jgi:hypothetical protein
MTGLRQHIEAEDTRRRLAVPVWFCLPSAVQDALYKKWHRWVKFPNVDGNRPVKIIAVQETPVQIDKIMRTNRENAR